MSRWIMVVVTWALGAGSAHADEATSRPMKTAILPAAGASGAVSEIDSGVGRVLMGRGIRDTMGPRSLVARLSALDMTRRAQASFLQEKSSRLSDCWIWSEVPGVIVRRALIFLSLAAVMVDE